MSPPQRLPLHNGCDVSCSDVFLLLLIHTYVLLLYLLAFARSCMRCCLVLEHAVWLGAGPRLAVSDHIRDTHLLHATPFDSASLPAWSSRRASHARTFLATRYSTYSYARRLLSAKGVPNKSRLIGRRCRSLLDWYVTASSKCNVNLLVFARDRCLPSPVRLFALWTIPRRCTHIARSATSLHDCIPSRNLRIVR
jgi:hypothetical protein